LNIELLVGMNVMQKKDMMLNCEKDILMLTNHHEFTVLFVRTVKQNIIYCCQFWYATSISHFTHNSSYKLTSSCHSQSQSSHLTIDDLNVWFCFSFHFKTFTNSSSTHTTTTSCNTHNSSYNSVSHCHSYLTIHDLFTHFSHWVISKHLITASKLSITLKHLVITLFLSHTDKRVKLWDWWRTIMTRKHAGTKT